LPFAKRFFADLLRGTSFSRSGFFGGGYQLAVLSRFLSIGTSTHRANRTMKDNKNEEGARVVDVSESGENDDPNGRWSIEERDQLLLREQEARLEVPMGPRGPS
jgi:hypothetical protein